jgi:HEAT repeat protein
MRPDRSPLAIRLSALPLLASIASIATGAVATTVTTPAHAEPAAKVDVAARVVRHGAGVVPITLPPAEMPDPGAAQIETVTLAGDRALTHVRVPSRSRPGVAWEALIAEPSVVFAGITGYATGQEGERSGQAIQIVPGDGGSRVLVGEIREDLRICGQAETLLAPRGLDPQSMTLRGASVQRLGRDARDRAIKIAASPRGGPADAPLAPLLVATGASSTSAGAPRALTDGDPDTTWSEARPGDGHGELVAMRAPSEVPIARLAITVSPAASTAKRDANGAAPRSFFLVTDTQTFAVTLPDDGWGRPGATYDIPLPEPIRASCLTLVLDDAYARDVEHPVVTIAELRAYSAFDGPSATLASVAAALSGGGPRAEAAAAVLKRAGAGGLTAAAAEYAKLDDAGRALAVDVAAGAPSCEASAPLLLAALGDASREVARKGREKLERCGKAAAPALVLAVKGKDAAARASAAPLLASIAPAVALDALAEVMGDGPAEARAAVRSAFARALRGAPAEKIASMVGDASRGTDARIDLLRASAGALPAIHDAAERAIDALLSDAANPTFRTRYLLALPLAELARQGDMAALARLRALASHDPDAAVRARALDVAAGVADVEPALAEASHDPEPRVREAAMHGMVGAKSTTVVTAATERLAKDDWTFVRTAAAATLAALPASPSVDGALARAVRDRSSRVREAAVVALAAHGARGAAGDVRARMEDEREDLGVRVSATRALGALCDRASTDALTERAQRAASPVASEAEMQIGLAAADALGKVHPGDLAKRLALLRDRSARVEVQRAAERAIASPPCR